MSIFKRLRDVTAATFNDMIDKSEDPVKMLEQYMRDLEGDIADAEVSVAKQIAVEKKIKKQWDEAEEMVEKREAQAMKAVESGDEELARRALQDKKSHQSKAEDFKEQYENTKSNSDQLRQQLQELKDEHEKMKNKKDTMVARAQSAKAQKQINQATSGIGKDNAAKGFERMNDKVMQMEAEAQASNELKGSNRTLEDELDKLESDNVDDELSALKSKMNREKNDNEEKKNQDVE